MATIREVTIDGLAGRRKRVRFRMNRDVNVFWGLNGSGKTSLLKILHSALLNDASTIVNAPFTAARIVLIGDDGIEYTQTIARNPSNPDPHELERALIHGQALSEQTLFALSEDFQWQSSPSVDFPWFQRHAYLPISRIAERRGVYRPPTRRLDRELADEAAYDQFFAEQITGRWREYNTQALVSVRRLQDQGIRDILLSVLGDKSRVQGVGTGDPREAYEVVTNMFATTSTRRLSYSQFAKTYQEDALARRVVAQIEDLNERIENAQRPQLRLEMILHDLFRGNKRIDFDSRELGVRVGDQLLPLATLSSGEKQILRILVEAIGAQQSTVIIDEPELSMHVDWQRQIVSAMLVVNPECQLILATHSPEVMANLDDEQVFEL